MKAIKTELRESVSEEVTFALQVEALEAAVKVQGWGMYSSRGVNSRAKSPGLERAWHVERA